MQEPTDEDFLALLENDPLIYRMATQEPPTTVAPSCPKPDAKPDTTTERKLQTEARISSSHITPESPPMKPEPKLEPISRMPTTIKPELCNFALSTKSPHALSSQEILNARRRRQNTVAEIDRALEKWNHTLKDSFADDEPAQVGKENSAPPTMTKEQLDMLTKDLPFNLRRDSRTRFNAGERNPELLTKDLRNVEVTPEVSFTADRYQAKAIEAAMEGKSFFLTGSAGTGKSFILKHIITKLREAGKYVAVTASTGCAAVGIGGGTIHSLAGLGIGMDPIERLRRKGRTDEKLRKRFLNLHTLVIDEISMIDSFLFDKIEAIIHAARCPPPKKVGQGGSGNKSRFKRTVRGVGAPFQDEPFGGLQVIVCGDFYQLPPVAASDHKFCKSPEKFFAFDSDMWRKSIDTTFMLRVVHRQADRKFVGLLNELRQGVVSYCTKQVLNACLVNPYKVLIEADEHGKRVAFTKLFSYRRQVASENSTQLKKLPTKGIRYAATDIVHRSELGTLTVAIVQQMLENTNCPDSIELRIGCRVLCTKNIDTQQGIVNGAAGIVVGWSKSLEEIYRKRKLSDPELTRAEMSGVSIEDDDILECDHPVITQLLAKCHRDENDCPMFHGSQMGNVLPVVLFDNGVRRLMECADWEVQGTHGQVVGVRKQVPLMLGWALSIHKAQGMTLGDVETDVGGAFDFGQVYVALSRATIVHRLRLRSFNAKKVVTHRKVKEFYQELDRRRVSPRKRLSCGCAVGECAGMCDGSQQ